MNRQPLSLLQRDSISRSDPALCQLPVRSTRSGHGPENAAPAMAPRRLVSRPATQQAIHPRQSNRPLTPAYPTLPSRVALSDMTNVTVATRLEKKEMEKPRVVQPLPPVPQEPLPREEPKNVQAVAEYASDIVAHLFREETSSMPRTGYMDQQADINAKMRAILLDWLVEVHMKYRLRPETLFLTVNIADRYLSCAAVPRKRLQLLGVVAMFIASKFEEIDPPRIQDFVYITDNTYTKNDIIELEVQVLCALAFRIVVPTPAHFFDRFQLANHCDDVHRELAKYLLELALIDIEMVRHAPSLLVAAALLASNEIVGRGQIWTPGMVLHTRYAEHSLRTCADELLTLWEAAPNASLQSVRKKYSTCSHSYAALQGRMA